MAKTHMDATKKFPMAVPDGQGGMLEIRQMVHLNQVIDHPQIEVGDFSYYHNFSEVEDYAGLIAPYLFPMSPEKLRIGKFCQLAHGVRFVTSSANHDMSGFSTYPFANFMLDADTSPEALAAIFQPTTSKGDTCIGNDVWIGYDAVVMPGVTVGDGAIIGARSVVVHDVAPYTVVGGNPAQQLKSRFDPATTEALLDIKWWDWPIEKIQANLAAIRSSDINLLKRCAAS